MCKLFLFGTPAIECSGRSQSIRRRKARALLAYLAVTQQGHSREVLATLLWPEYDRQSALADLSRILSSLRKTLGANFFRTDRESVALNGEVDLWVDVLRFSKQLESCRKTTGLDDDATKDWQARWNSIKQTSWPGLHCQTALILTSGSYLKRKPCAATWVGPWNR